MYTYISTLVSIDTTNQTNGPRLTWKERSTSIKHTRTHHPNITWNGCDLSDAGIFMRPFFSLPLPAFLPLPLALMCVFVGSNFISIFLCVVHFELTFPIPSDGSLTPSLNLSSSSSLVIWTHNFILPRQHLLLHPHTTYASYSSVWVNGHIFHHK